MPTREEFYDKLKKQLDEMNASVDRIQKDAASAAGDVREKAQEKLTLLKEKRDAAAKKLDEIKNAGSDAWESLKKNAENGVDSLKKALQKAKSLFTKD